MSGILGEAFTPCPSRIMSYGVSSYGGNSALDSFVDDDMPFEAAGHIEFTTEVRAPTLTGVRPRRANRTGSVFQIHDDGEKPPAPAEKRQIPNGQIIETSEVRKSSLLAQPAQRIRPKDNLRPTSSQIFKQETKPLRQPGRSDSNPKKETSNGMRPTASETSHTRSSPGLKNKVRRNTVYIPPDDTTVPNVFMDLFSPLKKQQGPTQPPVTGDTAFNPLESCIAKQQARKSLAVSARRAPLQLSTKIAQESVFRVDVAGRNGGKENIPPGMIFEETKSSQPRTKPSNYRTSNPSLRDAVPRNATRQLKNVRSAELPGPPQSTLPKRGSLEKSQNNVKKSLPASPVHHACVLTESKGPIPSASLNARASALSGRLGRSGSESVSNTEFPSSKLKEINAQYPKLTDDIKTPALYEDDWLSHQETVITQLFNALFEHSNGDLNFHDQNTLRLEFLELYHTDLFIQLYRKLQASLSCGTLSIPKHVLARSYRLRQDIGLRRRFLDIWIHSYEPRALAAAAETVVGRKISSDYDLFENDKNGGDGSRARKVAVRKLECFLVTFLLRNDDLEHSVSGAREISAAEQGKAYRRTVLRSIMLVSLLDQARQSSGSIIPRQLFLCSSQFKSSVDVLQALTRVLLPSCGDITKSLSHLGCHLLYKQHQLQEYKYQMENLAVDLRDGVRLTRIVEVLFFTHNRVKLENQDQTEVALNTGETFSLLGDHADVPLSKHLKYPSVSRAAKLFNVQIALSALNSIHGSNSIFGEIRPKEIVDGYREKTIALLWALVGSWGLAGLVDWDDVKNEILRLKRKSLLCLGNDRLKNEKWFTEQLDATNNHARLLQQWAGLLAGLKGLRIPNLTSSFADGKIYESIVDEYEPYIISTYHPASPDKSRCSTSLSLQKRLSMLGCSAQFAHLVCPGSASSYILDQECTLGALAFLCSRLLTASKRARAATILQRAWRAQLENRNIFRRSIAKNLATHCAAVVQTRNEILWAKDVIIRWWRRNQGQRRKLATQPQVSGKPSRKPPTRRL